MWTVCNPTASRLQFELTPFCAWVQHANHSANEPPIITRSVCVYHRPSDLNITLPACYDLPSAPGMRQTSCMPVLRYRSTGQTDGRTDRRTDTRPLHRRYHWRMNTRWSRKRTYRCTSVVYKMHEPMLLIFRSAVSFSTWLLCDNFALTLVDFLNDAIIDDMVSLFHSKHRKRLFRFYSRIEVGLPDNSWQYFNWHSSSCGPFASAKRLILVVPEKNPNSKCTLCR